MNLQECYRCFGGDYEDVCARLPSQELVRRMLLKYVQDPTLSQLSQAMARQDWEQAFRCVHTLKGICQTLGFTRLLESSRALTEALRPGTLRDVAAIDRLSQTLLDDHHRILEAAAQLDP